MRLVQVVAPQGAGALVAECALRSGAQEAVVLQAHGYGSDPDREVVNINVATPVARQVVDDLLAEPFFTPEQFVVVTGERRSILSKAGTKALTGPMRQPQPDVAEHLWQQSHITSSLVVRAVGSATLLSYGLVRNNLILIVAALLMSPYLMAILAIAFGARIGTARLVRQGVMVLALVVALGFGAGVVVGAIVQRPIAFHAFLPLIPALVMSIVVGIIASFATIDDAGFVQFIGTAAAAQLALYPAWLGLAVATGSYAHFGLRSESLGLNVLGIIAGSLFSYALVSTVHRPLRRYETLSS